MISSWRLKKLKNWFHVNVFTKFQLSPEFDMTAYQSGLNLLMLGLPGVTIIRSADEFGGDQKTDFVWEENDVSVIHFDALQCDVIK